MFTVVELLSVGNKAYGPHSCISCLVKLTGKTPKTSAADAKELLAFFLLLCLYLLILIQIALLRFYILLMMLIIVAGVLDPHFWG